MVTLESRVETAVGAFVGVGEEAVVDFELVGAGGGCTGGEFADYCVLKIAVRVFYEMTQSPSEAEFACLKHAGSMT